MTLKRIFDLIFSAAVLVFGFPIFLLLALLVKGSSKGPIFYGSSRIGKEGKSIVCFKFRTMYLDAEKNLEHLLKQNPSLEKEWKENHKLKQDVRITPIGKWLRGLSLDELPQFWNVFCGDLSVVGPRPVTDEELRLHFKDKKDKILSLRPGLTGIWQTSGRNNLPYEERVNLDEKYVDTRSFFLDLKLIFKTIPVMVFSKGAF